jgi:hypothetical protein
VRRRAKRGTTRHAPTGAPERRRQRRRDPSRTASMRGACGEPGNLGPAFTTAYRPQNSTHGSIAASIITDTLVRSLARRRTRRLVDGRRLGLSPIFTNGLSFTVGEPSRNSSPARRGLVPGEPVPAGLQTGDLGRRHRFDPTDKRGTSDTVPPCINRLPVGRRRVGGSDDRSRHDRPSRGRSMSPSWIS